jgi:eukaryotic-like serine/threonine-protein kinase
MPQYRLGQGAHVELGRELAKAGEGRVTEVQRHPEWVAKIFHTTFTGITSQQELHRKQEGLDRKRAKVAAMVKSKPDGWRDDNKHVVLAWPHDILLDGSTVAGFVMPKIDLSDVLELHQVSNPSDRRKPMPKGPQWSRSLNFQHLAYIAVNLATAVETAHHGGAIIGDFNERNVLVAPTTQVTLVDCDSMQFRLGSSVYPCEVGRPEYTAPEIQNADLRATARTPDSDLFALAVHIYSLLFDGAHPFQAGDWRGGGERPGAVERIKKGYYSGGPHSPIRPMRTALPMSFLPADILALFERAFVAGIKSPQLRPTPAQWRTALLKMIRGL